MDKNKRNYREMKYAIEELLTMSQDELVEIYEKEEALLKEGIVFESSLSSSFGDMTIEEVSDKYGLNEWDDVKNKIMKKLTKDSL